MITKGKNGLPVYELQFALEGMVDEFDDAIPDVTHVTFKRDYMNNGDLKIIYTLCQDVDDLKTNNAVMLDVVSQLLPRMTNLTPEQVEALHAKDSIELMGILGPFLVF